MRKVERTAGVPCCVLPGPLASGTQAALAVGWPVSLLPRIETCSSRRKVGCILSKGLICFSYFSAKFSSKQQVLGAHKATVLKPHLKAFPRKSSYLKIKWIDKLKVPFYSFVGEDVQSSMYTFIHTHPIVTAVGVFSYKHKFWEKSQRCFSLVLCIYIKKQSFVCFYYFNYCYKKPAIFNMWFGGIFFCCLFSCLGVLFVFVLFFWAKKKKTLAFSVCTAAGQDIIEVFLKIKEEK